MACMRKGYRYSHRLLYAYDGGNQGRIPMLDAGTARYEATQLGRSVIARGITGTYTIVRVDEHGHDVVEEVITTADILTAQIERGIEDELTGWA